MSSVSFPIGGAYGGLNGYWGQLGSEPLKAYCDSRPEYVTLSFVNQAPENTVSGYPGTNFAGHCAAGTYEGSDLLTECYVIMEGIPYCQDRGVKVLLSIGGVYNEQGSNYKVTSDEKGVEFANFLHGAFGPWDPNWDGPRPFDSGDESASIRPAVDGFDFDIEHDLPNGPYIAMINQLRSLREDIIITGAPQCPTSDEYFYMSEMISQAKFDALFVQFYNNPGCDAIPDPSVSWDRFNYDDWAAIIDSSDYSQGAKLYVGLPASGDAAGSGYLEPEEMKDLVCRIKNKAHFGGISLWDLTRGASNLVDGKNYNEHVMDALKYGCAPVPVISITTTEAASTTTYATTTVATTADTTTTDVSSSADATTTSGASTVSGSITTSAVSATSDTMTASDASTTSDASSTDASSTADASTASDASSTEDATTTGMATADTTTASGASSTEDSTASSDTSAASDAITTQATSASDASTAADVTSVVETGSTATDSSTDSAGASTVIVNSNTDASSTIESIVTTEASVTTGAVTASTTDASPESNTVTDTAQTTDKVEATESTAMATETAQETESTDAATTFSTFHGWNNTYGAPTHTQKYGNPATIIYSGAATKGSPAYTNYPGKTTGVSMTTSTVCTTRVHTEGAYVVTETIPLYTTVCPVTKKASPTHYAVPSQYETKTVYTTSVYTVTKCPPEVANCPYGSVTTETIPVYTTVCPATETGKVVPTNIPAHHEIKTLYTSQALTVTQCSRDEPNCVVGAVKTEIASWTTAIVPAQETQPAKVYKPVVDVPKAMTQGAHFNGTAHTSVVPPPATLKTAMKPVAFEQAKPTYKQPVQEQHSGAAAPTGAHGGENYETVPASAATYAPTPMTPVTAGASSMVVGLTAVAGIALFQVLAL
ncbi:Ff.00g045220.m01.CDS01 [Fusarium sp. VM40]|nr:Ff.00g045220.m01.CDS01 [Fusarium sp. VM40]